LKNLLLLRQVLRVLLYRSFAGYFSLKVTPDRW
jgi:hypothetical protein